ncbi:aminodeoxychorismate synthase component I [Staphylococcus simulans]|nr:aminodeoxychorismate synthase component I [Staphylococcus simulans]
MRKFDYFFNRQVKTLRAHFNYRYYTDETDYKQYQYCFKTILDQKIAYDLNEVHEVIDFAEQAHQAGHFVCLYLPYEAAPAFNSEMAVHLPETSNYVYAAAYIFEAPETREEVKDKAVSARPHFHFRLSKPTMIQHIQQVQDAIVEGNTYQVNYTTRMYDRIRMPISEMYDYLTRSSHGNYTALLDTDELQIASISPELFFQRGSFKTMEDVVLSKPMKGTMPRGKDKAEDDYYYQQLAQSKKDQAENVMIVDLLRNDIARISKPGSVKVYQPFHIERYQTVFQMTSMVTGQLPQVTSLQRILTALFPCGSITGAPKLNTMRYIKALEGTPRHVYCGTIGLMIPNGPSIFNVPIRTVQYIEDEAVYGVGAGITIDSNPEAEVAEFEAKTKILE